MGGNCHFGVTCILIIYTCELDELTQKVRVKGTGKAEPAALRIQRGFAPAKEGKKKSLARGLCSWNQ